MAMSLLTYQEIPDSIFVSCMKSFTNEYFSICGLGVPVFQSPLSFFLLGGGFCTFLTTGQRMPSSYVCAYKLYMWSIETNPLPTVEIVLSQ